jgi:hypothetical protein
MGMSKRKTRSCQKLVLLLLLFACRHKKKSEWWNQLKPSLEALGRDFSVSKSWEVMSQVCELGVGWHGPRAEAGVKPTEAAGKRQLPDIPQSACGSCVCVWGGG